VAVVAGTGAAAGAAVIRVFGRYVDKIADSSFLGGSAMSDSDSEPEEWKKVTREGQNSTNADNRVLNESDLDHVK
jgi:hypothetical protein